MWLPISYTLSRRMLVRARRAMSNVNVQNLNYTLPLQYPTPHLQIDFNAHKHNPRPSARLRAHVEREWMRICDENKTIFNAPKFQYAGISHPATLHLGLTDYKSFATTLNMCVPMTERSCPFGNVVIPITSDGYTLLLRRSQATADGAGRLVFPGGHAEPDVCSTYDAACIREELWNGARREVMEELFVSDAFVEDVTRMTLLGIVRRESDGKASLVFLTRLFCTAETVVNLFERKNVCEEATDIIVANEDVVDCVVDKPYEGVNGWDVMPELVGAAHLWRQMRRAREN